MKNLLFLFLFCFSVFGNANINIGKDYTHSITFSDAGVHQTGETITLSIKKNSNGYWFDFNDNTFKASGWTSKTVNLTEDATNHNYYYTWTAQGGDTARDSYIFHTECSGEFIVEETIIFEDFIGATLSVSAVWEELISSHSTEGTFGKYLTDIKDSTDGDTESSEYSGIENLIRRNK